MAKKILLIPAFQVPNVYNDSHVYSAVDFPNVDLERYSKVPGVTLLEVMLNPGEAIFMPMDWWYQVECLSVLISVNFTGFIAATIFFFLPSGVIV